MKEISIEEKAKRYDEAIERAKGVIEQNPLMEYLKKGIEYIFPELKESEDARVIRELTSLFKDGIKGIDHPYTGEDCERWLAWLEKKQDKQKPAWSEEGKKKISELKTFIAQCNGFNKVNRQKAFNLIDALNPQPKQEWSEEDERNLDWLMTVCERIHYKSDPQVAPDSALMLKDWLRSFKDRCTWKPSEEMLEALYRVTPENVMEKSEDEMLLDKLYQGLKYGKVLSEK